MATPRGALLAFTGLALVACASLSGLSGGGDAGGSVDAAADGLGGETADGPALDAGPPGDGGCGDLPQDPHNCGACGHDCLGSACAGGLCAPTLLAGAEDTPREIAVSTAGVFWLSLGTTQKVRSLPLAGSGLPTTLRFCAQVDGLAIDDAGAYITCACSPARIPFDGGAVDQFERCGISSFTTDDQNFYFYSNDALAFVPKATLATTPAVNLPAPPGVTWMAAGQSSVFFAASMNEDSGATTLGYVPRAGGSSSTLAPAEVGIQRVAVDDAGIFWTAIGDGTGDGGAVRTYQSKPVSIAAGLARPSGLALDDAYVYFTTLGTSAAGFTDGAIMKAPRNAAAPPTVLATGQTRPVAVAVYGAYVYWTVLGTTTGAVYRVAK